MKRWIPLSLLAALLGTALAVNPIRLDDSAIDYGDAPDDAYLALALVDDELEVVLDDEESDAAILPVEFDDVPIQVRDEGDGTETRRGVLTDSEDFVVNGVGNTVRRIEARHEDVELDEAVQAYRDGFAREGVSARTVDETATRTTLETDAGMRIVLRRSGSDVVAYLTGD